MLLQIPVAVRGPADPRGPVTGGGPGAVHALPGLVLLLHVCLQGQTHTGQDQEAVEECHREGEADVASGQTWRTAEGKGESKAVAGAVAPGTVLPSSRCIPLRMKKLMEGGDHATLKGYVALYSACEAYRPLPPQH